MKLNKEIIIHKKAIKYSNLLNLNLLLIGALIVKILRKRGSSVEERWSHNPKGSGSKPLFAIFLLFLFLYIVEHLFLVFDI